MSRDLDHRPLDTRPDERDDITLPRLGPVGLLRFVWRQLTSMRTALLLLLLLAIAAVPGSIWPQRGIDAGPRGHLPRPAPRPSARGWTGSGSSTSTPRPWFAAIYLLLFVSLVGCVLPRSRIHWHAMLRPAPARAAAPGAAARARRAGGRGLRRGDRAGRPGGPAGASASASAGADGEDPHTLSGESGYLRETGNLVFHAALIVVIIGIAIGHLFGWRGDRIVPVGETFSNTISAYDTLSPGPWVDTEDLKPFSVTIDKLDVTFEERARGAQFGAPRDFTAHTTTTVAPGAPERRQTLKVNGPLKFGGASVFLLGNGYAPVVTVRDAKGNVTYSGADAVPAAGQQLPVGRRDQGRRRPSPSSSASPGSSCPPPSRRSRTGRARCSPT